MKTKSIIGIPEIVFNSKGVLISALESMLFKTNKEVKEIKKCLKKIRTGIK